MLNDHQYFINMYSVIHNQLSASQFINLIKYGFLQAQIVNETIGHIEKSKYICFKLYDLCDDNSGMIGILFTVITIASKVVDPMTGFTIISTCSSSTFLLSYIRISLSLSLLFLFVYKDVFYVKQTGLE